MGVSDSVLHSQRVAAGAMAAPGEGAGGQNLDLALTLADGSATGRADPAYDAHMLPIGEWALAVWKNLTTHAGRALDEETHWAQRSLAPGGTTFWMPP